MNSGYIYILRNLAYNGDLLKIGRTKRLPTNRKDEIYKGSTGVPEPFVLVFSRKTSHQINAEKVVESTLEAFRHNENREFYSVKLEAAKKAINQVCDELEVELGNSVPLYHEVCEDIDISEYEAVNSTLIEPDLSNFDSKGQWIDPQDTTAWPIGRSKLTNNQITRICVVVEIFRELNPDEPGWQDENRWIEDFTRDLNPEKEIEIWEKMAKAYCKFTSTESLSLEEKEESFTYIMHRSGASKKQIKEVFSPELLNKRKFKKLEGLCRWKASPVRGVIKC